MRREDYGQDDRQTQVVSFRPDEEIRRFLRRKFRKKEILQNKSAFHQSVYRLGMKAMRAA